MLKLEMRRVSKTLTGDDVKYRGMVADRRTVDSEYLYKRDYDPVDMPGMREYNTLEADDTHVLMKWPAAVPRSVIGQKVSVSYIDYHNAPTA